MAQFNFGDVVAQLMGQYRGQNIQGREIEQRDMANTRGLLQEAIKHKADSEHQQRMFEEARDQRIATANHQDRMFTETVNAQKRLDEHNQKILKHNQFMEELTIQEKLDKTKVENIALTIARNDEYNTAVNIAVKLFKQGESPETIGLFLNETKFNFLTDQDKEGILFTVEAYKKQKLKSNNLFPYTRRLIEKLNPNSEQKGE